MIKHKIEKEYGDGFNRFFSHGNGNGIGYGNSYGNGLGNGYRYWI